MSAFSSIFAVSDLHLGDRGPRDNFAVDGREERFCRFLDYVEQENGRLYVLGDLFDWWQVNLGRSISSYQMLLLRLATMKARYVFGNHDSAMYPLAVKGWLPEQMGILQYTEPAFAESCWGRKVLFMHGHEADQYCSDVNPGIGEVTAILSGLSEDRNKGPFRNDDKAVDDAVVSLFEAPLAWWRKLTFQENRTSELVTGVERRRKAISADVVVYGHTHMAGHIGDRHFNAGCWCRRVDTFVRLDEQGAGVYVWGHDNQPHKQLLLLDEFLQEKETV